jgi:predicted transcriptional regulator
VYLSRSKDDLFPSNTRTATIDVMLISEIYHKHAKTLSASASVSEAVDELLRDEVNALVILSAKEKVVGVLSLQDIAAATLPRQFRKNVRMAAAMYKRGFFTEMCQLIKDEPVTSIMRKEFISVDLHDNIMAVIADFLKNDLYMVPVIDKGHLVGVVTRSEIKKALHYGMRNTESESENLQK